MSSSSSRYKWRGSTRKVVSAPIERLWAVASDYCNLHQWIPALHVCRWIAGDHPRAPGSVRYVEGSSTGCDGRKSWAKEKLLTMDESSHTISYALIESNLGMEDYVATMRVLGGPDGHNTVEWSFELSPMEGASQE
ncbi:hypothetical protein SELMODRAFT_59353, partial [Selaginella moellendorffii]